MSLRPANPNAESREATLLVAVSRLSWPNAGKCRQTDAASPGLSTSGPSGFSSHCTAIDLGHVLRAIKSSKSALVSGER